MQPFSRKRQSLINLSFHYVSIVLVIVQGIILTPLYLKYISPSLYGAWFATGNMLVWIQLVDPGLSRIMQQRVAHTFGQRDIDRLAEVIGTGLMLGAILSALPLLVIPFSSALTGTLPLPGDEGVQLTHAFQIALLSTCLTLASYQPTAAILGLQFVTGTGFIHMAATILGIVATVLLLVNGYGLSSLALGMLVRGVFLLIGNLALMRVCCRQYFQQHLQVSREELRTYAGLSAFTFIEKIGNALLQSSDAYLSAKLISPSSTAVLSLTSRAYEPVRMASERFGPAFLPSLAHLAGEGNPVRVHEVSSRLLGLIGFLISTGVACVIALNFAFVSLWVGPEFFGGQRLTVALGCAVVMSVVLSSLSDVVFATGGIGQVEIMKFIEGMIKVPLQIVMVKWLGLIGLPIGACAGMLLVSGWYLPRLAGKLFHQKPVEWFRRLGEQLLRSITMVGLGILAYMFASQLFDEWTWPRFALVALFFGISLAGAGLLLHSQMRQEVRLIWARVRDRLEIIFACKYWRSLRGKE